jgi:hypothetical protein
MGSLSEQAAVKLISQRLAGQRSTDESLNAALLRSKNIRLRRKLLQNEDMSKVEFYGTKQPGSSDEKITF